MAPRSALAEGGEHAGMPDQLNKHLNKQKEFIHGLVELPKETLQKKRHFRDDKCLSQ